MPVQPHPILDMSDEAISNVQSTIELDVLTREIEYLGTIAPLSMDRVEWNTSAEIKRNVGGVRLTRADVNDIDLFRHCLRPMWVLGDGTRWEMGVYSFTDRDELWRKAADARRAGWVDVELMDKNDFALSTGTKRTISIPPSGDIFTIVTQLLDEAGIGPRIRDIPDGLEAQVLDPPIWSTGTAKNQIISDCMELAGLLPPYSTNGGIFTIRRPPNVITEAPDHRYLEDEVRIEDGTIRVGDDLLSAPNVYVVVSNGPNESEIVGVAYIDPKLPWSKENRGFEIVDVHRAQGIESAGQATAMAQQRAATGAGYRVCVFDAFPDPRHDLFQTVQFDQVVWRETSHTLRAAPGGPHTHNLTEGGFPTNAAAT